MSFFTKIFGNGKKREEEGVSLQAMRPSLIDYQSRFWSDVAKLPAVYGLNNKFFYDLYYSHDLLRTVIQVCVRETLRNGVQIVDKKSGATVKIDESEEAARLWQFVEKVNLNGDDLLALLKRILIDKHVTGNAWLVAIKEYSVNDEGDIVDSKVVEFVQGDVELMELIMSIEGRKGRTDDGKIVAFCIKHRDEAKVMDEEEFLNARCDKCGIKLVPAIARARKYGALATTGTAAYTMKGGEKYGVGRWGYIYYTEGEVYHIADEREFGYGVSPIQGIWRKLMILIMHDHWILKNYELFRPPNALLVLKGNANSIRRAWKELMEEARQNPFMIYPLVVDPSIEEKGKMVEYVPLKPEIRETEMERYRDEVRLAIAAIYGVSLVSTGDARSLGVGGEGLAITVQNRAIMMEQRIVNRMLKWMSEQIGSKDVILELVNVERRDELENIRRDQEVLKLVKDLVDLGYDVEIRQVNDRIEYEVKGKKGDKSGEVDDKGSNGKDKQISDVFEERRERREVMEEKEQRNEGEPLRSRVRADEQRFEGEVPARRL